MLVLVSATLLNNVFLWLKQVKTIALVFVPKWTNHSWFQFISNTATHRIIFPVGAASWCEGGESADVLGFVIDFRYPKRASDMISLRFPSLEMCSANPPAPREVLPTRFIDLLKYRVLIFLSLGF